ncbi:MAG: Ppx/GppA family phosphatase [Acidobacteria bacterium]|nr:Ppx/GppA family phosphatase [Acidobacteriota bacterium]
MSIFAAIDIGANSVRLKIARSVLHRLKTIHEDRVVTRLGESVFRFGVLAPEAMDSTVNVLRRFHRAVQEYGAEQTRVVATSALRDARNSAAFTAWAHAATGWKVEIISGLEEGRLIHLGILASSRVTKGKMLLIDLGGGSCELTVSERGHIREMTSLPLGAVRLTQEFLRRDPPQAIELHRMGTHITEAVRGIEKRIARARVDRVIATSGTSAALAGAARWISKRYSLRKDNLVSREVVERLAEELSEMDYDERAKVPGIGPRRAEIIIAGAWVFAELMQRCNLPAFQCSPLGLRDGVLAQMLAERDRATRSRRQIESDRWDAILAMGKLYQVDMRAAEHVRELAAQLFDQLKDVHNLPPEYSLWLAAAAMLNDIGGFVNRNGRHRHTYYLIANSELLGFTPEQRQVVAAIARYLGKSRPAPGDTMMKGLSPTDEKNVPKAVALLRLAKAMSPGAEKNIQRAKATVQGGKLRLTLKARASADLEVWILQKERGFFREVFGRDLVVQIA